MNPTIQTVFSIKPRSKGLIQLNNMEVQNYSQEADVKAFTVNRTKLWTHNLKGLIK